jgi:hypothetical protein
MSKLIDRLAPKGLYAVAVERQGPTPEIHCVFEKDTDALKLATAMGATGAGRWLGKPANVPAGRRYMPRHRSRPEGPRGQRAAVQRYPGAIATPKLGHSRFRRCLRSRFKVLHLIDSGRRALRQP